MLHRRVVLLREHEGHACVSEAGLDLRVSRGEVDA